MKRTRSRKHSMMVLEARDQSNRGKDNYKKNLNPIFNIPGLFIGPNGLTFSDPLKTPLSIDNNARPDHKKVGLMSIVDTLNYGLDEARKLFGASKDTKVVRLFHNGSNSNVIFEIGKPASSLNLIKSGLESIESLSASEEYTCVISGGPNPKKTHIFCDNILECHSNSLTNNFDEKKNKEFEALLAVMTSAVDLDRPKDFLRICYFCQKNFRKDNDIYIYRGEKSFCSSECRSQLISVDDALDKSSNKASANPRQSNRRPG